MQMIWPPSSPSLLAFSRDVIVENYLSGGGQW